MVWGLLVRVAALLLLAGPVAAKQTSLPGTSGLVPQRTDIVRTQSSIRGGALRVDKPERLSGSPSFRVAFQGEPGAYSEKACRELLGQDVQTIGKESFEEAFQAVASREVDYALLPIENSLGGSIHANYDLLLRYNLYIVGEHTLRVRHCLLGLPGTKKSDIKRVLSHPQALAQCDNYIRGLRAKREPKYDTAGSAKFIKEEGLADCAAIASDLAGEIYGMDVIEHGIEDDDCNYTRFILLSRTPVGSLIPPSMPSKTTLVFMIDNKAGALYRALACFALRDIDLTKCESRPTSVQLLNYLAFSEPQRHKRKTSAKEATEGNQERFRYCFYLDYKANELDPNAQAALFHLREQSDFVRVLGSYPSDSKLVGPVKDALAEFSSDAEKRGGRKPAAQVEEETEGEAKRLRIGIVGFGKFGQFLAKRLAQHADIVATDKDDVSKVAAEMGVEFVPYFEMNKFMRRPLDVIVFSVSVLSFEDVLRSLSPSDLRGKLLVDTLTVKSHPKKLMREVLPKDCDILCTHPMFGPESAPNSWQALPFVYEQVRISDYKRCGQFLGLFEKERCNMVEMSAELHDQYALGPQFVTHLVGRILGEQRDVLQSTPIDTAGFKHALKLAEITMDDSFDLFFALYKHTPNANQKIASVREAMATVERQLASKEAYLAAQAEYKHAQRSTMLQEFRSLVREAAAQEHSQEHAQEERSPASTNGQEVMASTKKWALKLAKGKEGGQPDEAPGAE